MPQNPACIDPILLADQSTWVLSLARSLVRDPSGADDVAQETLLAGLVAPPQDANDPRRLRAWLGRVVFNLAHLSTRRSMRRRAREEEVARPERQISAADFAIRESVLRHVGNAVGDLREPYRSVVVMRYFEGLSTAAIAEASKTSESAVRKRLWRARGQLRLELEQRHNGERQAWFQAALPLLGLGKRPRGWVGLGGAALGAKLLTAAAILMFLLTPWSDDARRGQGTKLEVSGARSTLDASAGGLGGHAFLGYLRYNPIVEPDAHK